MFGVGGALVLIPVLGIFFGFTEQLAQGTALILVVPNVLLSLWRYFRRNSLDLRMAGLMAVCSLPPAVFASWLATIVPSTHLRMAYAIFLIVMLVEYARRSFASKAKTLHLPSGYVGIVGAISGGLAGFFTVGGTLFSISANTYLFSLGQLQAQGRARLLRAGDDPRGNVYARRPSRLERRHSAGGGWPPSRSPSASPTASPNAGSAPLHSLHARQLDRVIKAVRGDSWKEKTARDDG